MSKISSRRLKMQYSFTYWYFIWNFQYYIGMTLQLLLHCISGTKNCRIMIIRFSTKIAEFILYDKANSFQFFLLSKFSLIIFLFARWQCFTVIIRPCMWLLFTSWFTETLVNKSFFCEFLIEFVKKRRLPTATRSRVSIALCQTRAVEVGFNKPRFLG